MKEGLSRFQIIMVIWLVVLTILSISNLVLVWDQIDNQPPHAEIEADRTEILVRSIKIGNTLTYSNLDATVQFRGDGSFDPDGDPLTFSWDFVPWGYAESNEMNPTYTFPYATVSEYLTGMTHPYEGVESGIVVEYKVTLKVADPYGRTDTDTIAITLTQKVIRE